MGEYAKLQAYAQRHGLTVKKRRAHVGELPETRECLVTGFEGGVISVVTRCAIEMAPNLNERRG